MNRFVQTVKRYAPWLFIVLATNLFAALLLWLSDTRAFWALVGTLSLWSLILFASVLMYAHRKERKRRELFSAFLTNPDVIHEKRLLREISEQEAEQIRLLAFVLREHQLALCNLTEALHNYEEYVENWAHEAKTPLSLLTMILDNRIDELPSDLHTKLDYVRSQIQEDIEQILYYARLKSSTKDYRFEEVSLQDSLEKILADYAPLLEEKKFSIQNELGTETVFTDRRGLQFMLGQIISNVIKYSADTPKLIISLDRTEKGTILSFTDNGVGVQDYDLPYIFQKGFTGTSADSRNKATGMGLYLTKKMADDLSLKLEAASEYNKYFRISIHFPR
ncbi:signal transduction histidine kinase [Christensenellaceae bacterium]|nr:signal transduction histidine kinase [Christensenellaceae bacterium]BDF61485.1 signal transduction histidine kinase [Christensenellaceae bacterium]